MAVRIRLKRAGSRHQPFYKIIVADSRSPRDGADIESLGYYDPLKRPEDIKVDEDRYKHWLSVGASASESVETLVRRLRRRAAGLEEPEPVKEAPSRTAAPEAPADGAQAEPAEGGTGAEEAAEPGAGEESEKQ